MAAAILLHLFGPGILASITWLPRQEAALPSIPMQPLLMQTWCPVTLSFSPSLTAASPMQPFMPALMISTIPAAPTVVSITSLSTLVTPAVLRSAPSSIWARAAAPRHPLPVPSSIWMSTTSSMRLVSLKSIRKTPTAMTWQAPSSRRSIRKLATPSTLVLPMPVAMPSPVSCPSAPM